VNNEQYERPAQTGQHPLLAIRFSSPLPNRYLTQFWFTFMPGFVIANRPFSSTDLRLRVCGRAFFATRLPFLIMAIALVLPERERAG
jgi:hypothetical protein